MKALAQQPKPFYLIFLIEIWERFGFYGVQVLLVLFMVEKLGFTDAHADFLFTAFSALVFLLPCLGGWIGDHVLGTKRTIVLGAIVLAMGYLLLSLPIFHSADLLVLPLAVIALGNGLFKANPSNLLSVVYQKTSHNVDSGFTLYYMAVNIGALISMNLTPVLSKYFGWEVAFGVCFLGLTAAIINFAVMRHSIKDYGSAPDHKPMRKDYLAYVIMASILSVGVCYLLLLHYEIMSWLLGLGTAGLMIAYFGLTSKAKAHERKGMFLFVILFAQAIIFFVLYFQMPTSVTLFALRNVHHSILGIPIQPAQFYMLNPFWIMVMSPILAALYQKLSHHGYDMSMPSKFSLGTLLAGIAFLVLPLGSLFANHGVISGMWLVISYWFQSTGELLVSALGLSMAAQYIPQRFMGFAMGLWFLSTSIASIIAGKVASIASVPKNISTDPTLSLPIYNHLFLEIGIVTVVIALGMFALVPVLKKLITEKQSTVSTALLDEDLVSP